MKKFQKKIIAIGGGGFTHQSDKNLDQFVIKQSKKKEIKLGFLPTASKDNKKKIDLFYKRFNNLNFQLSHFSLCSDITGFDKWILSKDIVYIGGGNTSYMLEIWKKNNLARVFAQAYNDGVILSGVSAGGACWFEWILSDSKDQDLKPLKGINLIKGSCTPHSSDSKRINKFELEIKNSKLPPGIAIDDGVAVLFIDGKPSQVYSSRKNHDAYFVNKKIKVSLKEYMKI